MIYALRIKLLPTIEVIKIISNFMQKYTQKSQKQTCRAERYYANKIKKIIIIIKAVCT